MQVKLLKALRKILVTSDFKSAKKKFLDMEIPVLSIDDIFERFKKLKDQHRIEKDNEKNIDYWASKKFYDLVDFVESLEKTPSKTKLKKAPWKTATPEGAIKVTENDSWVVYKIESYEASKKLGTRNWCISRNEGHYESETNGMVFYFLISKNRSYDETGKVMVALPKEVVDAGGGFRDYIRAGGNGGILVNLPEGKKSLFRPWSKEW